MSTFIEKSCVGITDPAFIRNRQSRTIELLRLRQCRDSCCPKIFTDRRAEELVDRGFATTDPDKTSTSKEAGVGTFPIRREVSDIGATKFTIALETAGGPIVPTSVPAKNLAVFLYEVNGGAIVAGAELYLSDSPGKPQRLKDTQTISGLISGDVITHKTIVALTSDSTGTGYTTVLETGTFTLP
tara:strand:- start:4897 stop:5451 length:555 start_codon:yes stop_codon:yes gene_type:complete